MRSRNQGLVKVGDTALAKDLAADLIITPAEHKLLDAATAIRMDPDAVEKAYMARELVHCTLPHRDPGHVEAWVRCNGNLTLFVREGWDYEARRGIGYPYGSIHRLLLYWVTSEAVRTKNRRLELGRNLAGFMAEVGLNPNTGRGKRGDAKRLREQMHRLFRATIGFERTNSQGNQRGFSWLDMQVAPTGELWWDVKRPEQMTLFKSWIELGEKFFEAITSAPVPADMRALKALKRSPLR